MTVEHGYFDFSLECDLLVVGGGVAGLSAARRALELDLDVVVIDSVEWRVGARRHIRFADAATNLAQGGLAVVGLADDPTGLIANGPAAGADSVAAHVADTLDAGAGHCDATAVEEIISGGAAATEWLIGLGARFDRSPDHPGVYSRTREGGHSARRIIHAGGDATGAEIQRALEVSVTGVRLLQNARARQLLISGERVIGAVVDDPRGRGVIAAGATLLATGGVGHIYQATTAAAGARGEAIGLALDAGARVKDMEFIQFHPTVLYTRRETGRRLLISEAVRGEGARLVDSRGDSITQGVDPRGDLAPRDIVSRAIATRLRELGEEFVYLDARHLPDFASRFPTITAGLAAAEIDPARDLIPVTPAVHYTCGGIEVTPEGRTCVGGLYAAGECSATGLHGANRLASNSLLEGLVVGKAAAEDVARAKNSGTSWNRASGAEAEAAACEVAEPRPDLSPAQLARLQRAMQKGAGVTRTRQGLDAAAETIRQLPQSVQVLAARTIVEAALARPYTLGCHTWLDAEELEKDTK
nr:L-aspartate oxidase [Corynebacterium lactis]